MKYLELSSIREIRNFCYYCKNYPGSPTLVTHHAVFINVYGPSIAYHFSGGSNSSLKYDSINCKKLYVLSNIHHI